jgi:hypothetical protein
MKMEADVQHPSGWLTGVSLIGTVALVAAAHMIWVALTRPDALTVTLSAWLGLSK